MTSTYQINLNPNIATPVKTGYTFKVGDKGVTFNIHVSEMDSTGTSAKIVFMRSNGASVEASLTGQGPDYTYTILGNEFAVPGKVVADLKFYNSTTQRVSTASFIFNVLSDTLDGIGEGTGGYSDTLERLTQELNDLGDELEDLADDFEKEIQDVSDEFDDLVAGYNAQFAETLQEYIDAFGVVGPVNPRGYWNFNVAYNVFDLVYFNGSSWLCRIANNGQLPAEESTYWQEYAKGVNDDAFYECEAWARGTKNGVPVSSSDPTYHNNSKYYSEQSEQFKEDAADILTEVQIAAQGASFSVNFITGELEYTNNTTYTFSINTTTGNLEWEVVA